jgi:hypothetical protein
MITSICIYGGGRENFPVPVREARIKLITVSTINIATHVVAGYVRPLRLLSLYISLHEIPCIASHRIDFSMVE